MPCVFRTQIGARVSHTATLSKLDYFRLMGKRTDGSHTILEVEHLSIAIICSIHFLQTRIGISVVFDLLDFSWLSFVVSLILSSSLYSPILYWNHIIGHWIFIFITPTCIRFPRSIIFFSFSCMYNQLTTKYIKLNQIIL